MITPTEFVANPESSVDNYFADTSFAFEKDAVVKEAAALRDALVGDGVKVIEIDPAALPQPPQAPDGCFPNNWVMFVDGKPVLCPMKAVSRRRERAMWPHIAERLSDAGYRGEVIDLAGMELEGQFLEGTGSLVLDRVNRIAFAALSERTSIVAAERAADLLGYRLVAFAATDAQSRPVYHTNVLMSIGSEFSVLCPAAVSPESRDYVRGLLREYREVIEISWDQVLLYCGNVLEVSGGFVAMSKTAFQAFDEKQLQAFGRCKAEPLVADISTIERVAGGSVRCMLAEVF